MQQIYNYVFVFRPTREYLIVFPWHYFLVFLFCYIDHCSLFNWFSILISGFFLCLASFSNRSTIYRNITSVFCQFSLRYSDCNFYFHIWVIIPFSTWLITFTSVSKVHVFRRNETVNDRKTGAANVVKLTFVTINYYNIFGTPLRGHSV